MRRMRPSTLAKMFASYAVVAMLVTLIVGVVAGREFTTRFRESLDATNTLNMERIGEGIRAEVLDQTYQVSNNILLDTYDTNLTSFFTMPISGNHYQLANAYTTLTRIVVAQSSVILGIEIYYADHEIVLSSGKGVLYLRHLSGESTAMLETYNAMLARLKTGQQWLERSTPSGTAVSFVITYPYAGSGGARQGCIMIDVNTDEIARLLERMNNSDAANTYVIGKENTVLASMVQTDGVDISAVLETDYMNRGSTVIQPGGEPFLVTVQRMPEVDWTILRLEPMAKVYGQANALLLHLVTVCLIAVTVGMGIAMLFSLWLYAPLRRLREASFSKLGALVPEEGRHKDVYADMRVLIDNVAGEMNTLKLTVQSDEDIIKSNVLYNLMVNPVVPKGELDRLLPLMGINQPARAAAIVLCGNGPTWPEGLREDLLRRVEALGGDTRIEFHAAELEAGRIGIWASSPRDRLTEAEEVLAVFLAHYGAEKGLPLPAAFGTWEEEATYLHRSYQVAAERLAYAFYLPEEPLLRAEELTERMKSSRPIDEKWARKMERALNMRSPQAVQDTLDGVVQLCRARLYTHRQCRRLLVELVRILYQYGQTHTLPVPASVAEWEDAFLCGTIYGFAQRYRMQCETFLETGSDEGETAAADLVARAKRCVEENLSGDLALVAMAELLDVKPGYLSRKFKELAGVNYVEYVTACRTKKAAELLVQTARPVGDIAMELGFNSVTYFNRRFKADYGISPGEFRRRNPGTGEAPE